MKVIDLNTADWQKLLDAFREFDKVRDLQCPPAIRCEHTQLTTGWRCGGFTMNGHMYTSFSPKTPEGEDAMLAVRMDFLKWATKRLKEQEKLEKQNRPKPETEQPELF